MTDDEILTLASKYLELHPIHGDESVWDEWSGKPEDLLKFSREIFEKGQQEEIRRQKTGIGYVNGMLVVDEF